MSYGPCRHCGAISTNSACVSCRKRSSYSTRVPNRLKEHALGTIDFSPSGRHGEPSFGDRLSRGFRALRGEG